MRIAENGGVSFVVHTYDAASGFVDGVSSANKIGMDVERCFKTLVIIGADKEYFVAVIPVAEELDFKKVARHFGEKNIEMIHHKDLTSVTGYIKGGCSPIGMKKQLRTAIDETALLFDSIGVSGGKIGLTLELNPEELAKLINADFGDLTK